MAETRSYTYMKGVWKGQLVKWVKREFSKREVGVICMGFFLAMASPLPGIAPFGISYLAQERRLRFKSFLLFLAVCLGGFTACGRLGGAKYAAAGILYLSSLFVLKRGIKINDVTAGLVAGGAVLISGIAALIVEGANLLGVVLLLCETAATVSATLMMEKSIQALSNRSFSICDMDGDTKLSLAAVLLIALLGFQNIYIGSSLSVMMVAATVILLSVSAVCGARYSTGVGVVLGIVCGIGSDFFMPILGAFSFCGFLSGVFSKFGKGGVIAGVVLANGIMAVYTGTAMESVLSLYEVLIAAVIFGFMPNGWLDALRSIFYIGEDDRESIMRIKSGLKARLNQVASAVDNMAKTINGYSVGEYEGIEDISTLFDRAADKVCAKCRKSTVCWGKGFDSMYDELFKLSEVLKTKGVIKPEDITERLGANCLNIQKLADELNHQFDIYRVHQVWNGKISESRKLMAGQLGGMSDIIESLSRDIDKETGSGMVSAYEIRNRLEMWGIRVKDVSITNDIYCRQRVELVVKSHNTQGKERRTIERIVKSISGCSKMTREEVLENKKLVRLIFSTEERFAVETEHASRGVHNKNGDNFRMIHLKDGKFVIALSDGMGTGEDAAKESQAMLELLDSFLEAGFDSRLAVKMINSIMAMKSGEGFVTLDLCIIDLYTGEVRFVKTGAEPSFILNKGGRVRTVKASSLPVGLVADAKAEVSNTKMQDGDKIIMMTDGVSMSHSGESWVDGFLKEKSESDGEISEEILNHAIEQSQGIMKDDMTVLTVKLKAV